MTMRHVVCFRFKPDTTTEQVVAMAQALEELPGLIPEIADYRVGPDLGINETSWDFAVCADFASTEDYLTYRDHPEHVARIQAVVLPLVDERASVQLRT